MSEQVCPFQHNSFLSQGSGGSIYISSSSGLQPSLCQHQPCIAIICWSGESSFLSTFLLTLSFTSVQDEDVFAINHKARFQIYAFTFHQRLPGQAGLTHCSAQMELMGCLFLHGPPSHQCPSMLCGEPLFPASL